IAERMADVLAVSPDDRSGFVAFARRVSDPPRGPSVELASLLPSGNLPPPLTPFIGREKELAQIAARVADPACRLLTLVRPGGIGKTRLALQAASDRREEFVDGAYFVALTPMGRSR